MKTYNAKKMEKLIPVTPKYCSSCVNEARVHYSLGGKTPDSVLKINSKQRSIKDMSWKSYCSGLYYVPDAA